MRTVKVNLKGVAPIAFSKHYEVAKLEKESPADYEERTWRNRCHTDKEGQLVIPAMMFKNMMRDVGAFLSEKIPGKRNQTYAKHFKSGILVVDSAPLRISKDDVQYERLFVPSDGVAGSGKRVWKNFPLVHNWEVIFTCFVLDETITQAVFEHHCVEAGRYIGMGFFRPARGGVKGRFEVTKFEWLK